MNQMGFLVWSLFAVAVGGVTWFSVHFFGIGLVKLEATPLAILAAAFAIGLKWIRFPAPSHEKARKAAILSKTAKRVLIVIFIGLTGWALLAATQQGLRGYPELDARAITAGAEVDLNFYAVTGKPLQSATYEMRGSEGEHLLVPFDTYEGRVIIMLDHKPSGELLRATGLLRTDVRTVQRARDGRIDGPFLRLYREHVGLPQDARIYFLDTGKRAGLNLRAIACVLVPLYLLLLTLSAPIRKKRPLIRPKSR